MARQDEDLAIESGERMDTLNDNDSYGSDDDGAGHRDFGNIADEDKLSVDLDDLPDDDDDDDDAAIIRPGDLNQNADQSKVNQTAPSKSKDQELDNEEKKEVQDVENRSGSSGSDSDRQGVTNQSTGGSSGSHGSSAEKLFAVGESNDKGLADMETGSEVYMSELLVS